MKKLRITEWMSLTWPNIKRFECRYNIVNYMKGLIVNIMTRYNRNDYNNQVFYKRIKN